ncbi:MAG: glycosyltransferase family 25 protein [Paracoccaceae bacterium]|nr:glycosyltransferase family 25 protein [Paracoccaceae bacterium]
MKIYYINLEHAQERRNWMEGQFANLGLVAERFPAVTVDEIPLHRAKVTVGNAMERPWIDAEIACFLSHRACWQRIADRSDPFAAIFEDDVHLSPGAGDFLRSNSWLPAGLELVKLETGLGETELTKESYHAGDRQLHVLAATHLGAAGYIVSREMACRLLAQTRSICLPVDNVLFDTELGLGRSAWQLTPAICIQDNNANPDQVTLRSQIGEGYRGLTIRPPLSVPAKIRRELLRPLHQLSHLLSAPFRRRRPKTVPFR